jgi:uncharacterized membrane protein YsdA (DUF1294 family)/cold shock CspA family protein
MDHATPSRCVRLTPNVRALVEAWSVLLVGSTLIGGLSAWYLRGASSWAVAFLLPPAFFLAWLLGTEYLMPYRGGGASMWPIVRWDAAKGFGFIRGDSGGQDIFVHVRDYRADTAGAPRESLHVSFEEVHVGGKGPRAMAVRPVTAGATAKGWKAPRSEASRASRPRNQHARRPVRAPSSGALLAQPLMIVYGLALVSLAWQRRLPWWVLAASFLLNLATFFAYWQDKTAAQQRRWRISEGALHLWSLAGGWGGAWFAQQALRHKTAKESFRRLYWATVVLHCAGALVLWRVARGS